MASNSTSGIHSSNVIPKPVIKWTELSRPIETTTNKVSRNFGKCLIVVGVLSGVGRQLAAARMTASPDTIIRTCYTLQIVMVVSLVTGAVLWFFNRLTEDPNLLLKQRNEVKNEIEKTALADLRKKYQSPFVLSDSELNQWIRYLALSSSFFSTAQSDSIFTLPLEEETKNTLKDRYLDYVNYPATKMTFKTLTAQKPFQALLSEPERENLKKFVANREAAGVSVWNAATYRTFMEAQGVAIVSHLTPENMKAVAQGFSADAMASGVGIKKLKENRAVELRAFGAGVETDLFQQVANRDGSLSYVEFYSNNGEDAVVYITKPKVKKSLFESFFNFVIGKKCGLVAAMANFGTTINVFGEDAAKTIYSRVLNDDIDALVKPTLTYVQFRKRNGIGVIESKTFGDNDLISFLKNCFLRLSAADLVNPDYEVDRTLFGVTAGDIQAELWRRWTGMTFARVLQTDRDGFVASVSGANRCFDPRDWSPKAVQEMASLPIKDILSTYGVLFTTGVLIAGDGDIKSRLAVQIGPITEWTALIDKYGAFVFEHKLVVSTQVEPLVSAFIQTNAESFLNDSFEGALLRYVEVIRNFCMNPTLAQKINDAKATVATEKTNYAERSAALTTHYDNIIQAREAAAEQEIAQLKADCQIARKESDKDAAHREWSEKKRIYEPLEQGVTACQEEIQRLETAYNQEGAALAALRSKQTTTLALAQYHRTQAEGGVQVAQVNLQRAEAFVKSQPFYAMLEALLVVERQLQGQLEAIGEMQREYDSLIVVVNNPLFVREKRRLEETIANPDKSVAGLEAAKKARRAVEETPRLLAEMRAKEERLALLTSSLSQTNLQSLTARLSEIRSAKPGYVSTLSQVEAQALLPQLRFAERQALEEATRWKALETEAQSLPQQITALTEKTDQLRRQIDKKTGALGEKRERCKESRQQFLDAEARKESTEKMYNISAKRLAESTLEIRQACTVDTEKMRKEKALKLSEAQSLHTQALQGIVSNFRITI